MAVGDQVELGPGAGSFNISSYKTCEWRGAEHKEYTWIDFKDNYTDRHVYRQKIERQIRNKLREGGKTERGNT